MDERNEPLDPTRVHHAVKQNDHTITKVLNLYKTNTYYISV